MNLSSLQQEIEELSLKAGELIMEIYQRSFEVLEKGDKSPLTEADMAAHRLIVARLKELTPAIPILSEEDVPSFPGPDADGRYWLVDPLDGTKEFIKRNGEFTVNIALIEQGKAILGVVHAPAQHTTYSAAQGCGATKIDAQGARTGIRVTTPEKGKAVRVVGSRSHAGDSLDQLQKVLGDMILVPMGSSLKLCLVAEGAADFYPRLGPTSLWDTAAAQCVVEQAGGSVTGPEGRPLSYAKPSEVLNPCFLVVGGAEGDWLSIFA